MSQSAGVASTAHVIAIRRRDPRPGARRDLSGRLVAGMAWAGRRIRRDSGGLSTIPTGLRSRRIGTTCLSLPRTRTGTSLTAINGACSTASGTSCRAKRRKSSPRPNPRPRSIESKHSGILVIPELVLATLVGVTAWTLLKAVRVVLLAALGVCEPIVRAALALLSLTGLFTVGL
jgi:hypothetical protein